MTKLSLTAFFVLQIVSSASAQLVVDGDSYLYLDRVTPSLTIDRRTGGDAGFGSAFLPGGGSDQVTQHWWWYRVNGLDTREYAVVGVGALNTWINGNTLTKFYEEAHGLTYTFQYTLIDGTSTYIPRARLAIRCTIENTSSTMKSVSTFCYSDFDLQSSGVNDTAAEIPVGQVGLDRYLTFRQIKPSFIYPNNQPHEVTVYAWEASAVQVGTRPSSGGSSTDNFVLHSLTDNSVSNFSAAASAINTPSNVVSAIQWDRLIPPGGNVDLYMRIDVAQEDFGTWIQMPACDDIDYNNNGVFPEDQDIIDYFNALAGSRCATCNDIDFNNNFVYPEDSDLIDFLSVLEGFTCSQ